MNGGYLDKGKTRRRHIIVQSVQLIGKEANKWEEQYHVGLDKDAQNEYGVSAEEQPQMKNTILEAIEKYGTKLISEKSGFTQRHIQNFRNDRCQQKADRLNKLFMAAVQIERDHFNAFDLHENITTLMKQKNVSLRELAKNLRIDPSNLSKLLNRKRNNPKKMAEIHDFLMNYQLDHSDFPN